MPTAALAHAARARLFDALARTLDAGLTAERALSAAQDVLGGRRHAEHLAGCVPAVQRGATLSRVLKRAGLVTGNDAALLEAGERAGAAPRVLAALARRYERLHAHGQRMRARLAMPLAVLAIGVLALPLPALVSGSMGAAEYLLRTGAAAAGVTLALVLLARVLRGLTRGAQPAGCERWPLLGGWLADEARVTVLEQLHMLLAAGVAAQEATAIGRRNAAGGLARRWLGELGKRLSAGEALADAVAAAGLLGDAGDRALLATGEAAGRTEDMLARIAEAARARLDSRIETIAEWTPRAVYALVVVALAASFVGS